MRYVPIERGATISGDSIMDEVATYINDRLVADGEPSFQSTWLLVAQWDRIHPYPHGDDNRKGVDEDYLDKVRGSQ